MDKFQLVKLCSRTWSLTALSLMAGGVSGRIAPLAAAAGCGRTSMGASVAHLVALGLLESNPGYGHPLRPEYRFTPQGEYLAEWALQLDAIVKSEHDKALVRNKWSLPLMNCLSEEVRYSEIRRQLVPATDRAISACLGRLSESHWIRRKVSSDTSPLIVSYRAINTGQRVCGHLLQIADCRI